MANQKALSSNIANVETPGYHRRSVNFFGELQQAIANQRQAQQDVQVNALAEAANDVPLALSALTSGQFGYDQSHQSVRDVAIKTDEDLGHSSRNDDNSVDIEREMVDLARNSSKFKALTVIQGRLNQQLKGVINSSANG